MADVAMPRLSDSMEEGTILKWLKSDGDEVKEGEELVEIETDKANMTYEADDSGTLSIVAKEGDTLAVGETIAKIGEGGGSSDDEEEDDEDDSGEDEDEPEAESEEDSDDEEEDEPEAEAEDDSEEYEDGEEEDDSDEDEDSGDDEDEDEPEAESEEDSDDEDSDGDEEAKDEGGSGENGRVKASPIARRMAKEMGLELAGVKGSGPGGRIVKADVEAAASKEDEPAGKESKRSEGGKGEVEHVELSRLQRTVARRMAESKATAPDFVMTLDVDMEEAVALRGQLKAAAGEDPAPSFNDFVIKAAALALRDFPRATGAYRDGQFELYGNINIGVAVLARTRWSSPR